MADALARENVAVYAVSYDPVDVLATFADTYDISYTLLSDVGSVVIEQLGLLNVNVREHHGHYGVKWQDKYERVPYAGVFALDTDGVVIDKRFQQSYRVRETGAGTIARALDIATPPAAEARGDSDAVAITIALDSDSFRPYQRLWLSATLELDEGWHCYGHPVPSGFIAAEVTVDPTDGVEVGDALWPDPDPFSMDGLDESFFVYEGTVTALVPLTFATLDGEDRTVTGRVSFQVCTELECLRPAAVDFSFDVRAEANVASALS